MIGRLASPTEVVCIIATTLMRGLVTHLNMVFLRTGGNWGALTAANWKLVFQAWA